MEEMLKIVIESDKRARDLTKQLENQKQESLQRLEQTRADILKKSEQDVEKQITAIRREGKEKAGQTITGLETRAQKVGDALTATAASHAEEWVSEIVRQALETHS